MYTATTGTGEEGHSPAIYIAVPKIIEATMTKDLNVKIQACTTLRAAVFQQLLEPERSRKVC